MSVVLQSHLSAYTHPVGHGWGDEYIVPVKGTKYSSLGTISITHGYRRCDDAAGLRCGTREAAERVVTLINSRASFASVAAAAAAGVAEFEDQKWYPCLGRPANGMDTISRQIYLAWLEERSAAALAALADSLEDAGQTGLAGKVREELRAVLLLEEREKARSLAVEALLPTYSAKVYANEKDAKLCEPAAFREVCTHWGRAGYIAGRVTVQDRVVIRRGIWWDAPEPGGRCVVYYFG